MTALARASAFCASLSKRGIRYHLDIVREEAVMICLAVPGERWEIEFLDDGTTEIERFESTGVAACDDPAAMVLTEYE